MNKKIITFINFIDLFQTFMKYFSSDSFIKFDNSCVKNYDSLTEIRVKCCSDKFLELYQIDFKIDNCKLLNIKKFIMNNLNLINLPKFNDNCSLIDCSKNKIDKIKKIPKNIEIFLCSNNNLDNVEFLQKCDKLWYIAVSSNQIKKINLILPNLKIVNITKNKKMESLTINWDVCEILLTKGTKKIASNINVKNIKYLEISFDLELLKMFTKYFECKKVEINLNINLSLITFTEEKENKNENEN